MFFVRKRIHIGILIIDRVIRSILRWESHLDMSLRLRRMWELYEVFEERLGELRRYPLKSGFRTDVVDAQLQKVKDVSRTALFDQAIRV